MGPPSRHEWIMAGLVVLAMFLWITGANPAISLPMLGSNFINPTMVVFVVITLMLVTGIIEFDDIVAEKSAWEVFFYFTSLLTLSSGLNEIGFIKWVAEGYAKPLATLTLLCLYSLGLMGVISPYATGPAPMYFGSGYIGKGDFWKFGLIFGLIYFAGLLVIVLPWLQLLGW